MGQVYAVPGDCGNIINPMIVQGRIDGGLTQGVVVFRPREDTIKGAAAWLPLPGDQCSELSEHGKVATQT